MKAAIYARFSSHNQREESIEGQVRACKRFAKEHGMTVIEIYADRGISGLHADNRPEFQRMIQDSDHHRFEALIMWNLDRFSRDKYDTAVYKTRLKKNGVSLYYSDQSIPDTPEGIILESLLEGFAQYYSANLARNAKRGLQENARKCLWNGGCVPLGYLIDEHQRFVLEPIGAACVRMIFELYASGQSIKSIVCTLNEKGYKTVKGNRFRLGSIQGILRNRKYIGEYHASGITVPNGIPAIVDVQLFNDVQARLGVVASAKAHNKADIPYLLTTKVFCGHCGSPMIGESGTGKGGATYRYYKCSCRKNRKGTCDKKTEPKDWLEENVVRQTVKNVLHPEVIKEISENCAAALKADASDESLVQALKAQLAETDKALRNLLKAIEAGIISSTTRERMAELESQKSELEAQIAREQLRKPEITAEQISFWLESFLAGDIHDPKYQERIINALVRRVDVYDDGPEKQKLTIFYNITKNNRSSSKISISKCSDIECIALATLSPHGFIGAQKFPLLRVVLGPQDDAFTEKGLFDFKSALYTVTQDSNRMAAKLSGAPIEAKAGVDILSDGIVEGSVQVSANGQPIVMLADHQSTGGYAKIATVIPCDIPALAQVRPGQLVGFRAVSVEEGAEACRKEKEKWTYLKEAIDHD